MSKRVVAISILLLSLSASTVSADPGTSRRELFRLLEEPPAEALALPAAVAERPVRFDLGALEGRELVLPLFEGVRAVERTEVERRGARDFTWRGAVLDPGGSGEPSGYVTLTVRDGKVRGRITAAGAPSYEILPVEGGGHRLVQIDEALLDPCGADEPSDIARDLPGLRAALAEAGTGAAAETVTRLPIAALYTPGIGARFGSAEGVRHFLQSQVDVANTAYANSRILVRLELTHVEQTSYAGSGDGRTDLLWLDSDPGVAELRRRWRVPFVTLLVERMPGLCGIATGLQRSVLLDRSQPARGSSAIRAGCGGLLLAHEVGHNFGCQHDPDNAGPARFALFPHAYGHAVPGRFHTVMAYRNACGGPGCTWIEHFSNPGVSFDGHPTGIPGERDNHLVINATRTRFLPATNPPPACRPGPDTLCLSNGRFRVEADWRNPNNRRPRQAQAVPRTNTEGLFTFADPAAVELAVRVLDFGNAVRLYYGQLTNLPFNLTITDTWTGARKTYGRTEGNCGAADLNVFGSAARTGIEAPVAACESGPTTICLADRFRVNVTWRNSFNQSGPGHAIPVSAASGGFHFGNPNELDLMTKVVATRNGFDFYYGSLSDLEYRITVTDTRTGVVRTYENPLGTRCGGFDDRAF